MPKVLPISDDLHGVGLAMQMKDTSVQVKQLPRQQRHPNTQPTLGTPERLQQRRTTAAQQLMLQVELQTAAVVWFH